MKKMLIALVALSVIMAGLVMNGVAYAFPAPQELRTSQTIFIRLIIPARLSLNLEDAYIQENLNRPEGEAFSELGGRGVRVEKLERDNNTVWLFTKTE